MGLANNYPLDTGEADKQRLTLLNQIYNPVTQLFILQSGLKAGMHALEIGCGTGHMSAWLAQQVGPTGQVTAIDYDSKQLAIAEQTAKNFGVNNIEFKKLDIRNLNRLTPDFDFCYGRWIIEFLENPMEIFQSLYAIMKPGAILTYEALNFFAPGQFSYPHRAVVDQWFENSKNYFSKLPIEGYLGEKLFYLFKQLGCQQLAAKINQPILVSVEEKSVLRLAVQSTAKSIYQNTPTSELNNFLQELVGLEKDDVIVGFFRNFLVKGVKQSTSQV